MTQQPNDNELRERLRNLKRTSPTDPRYPIHAYEDDLVALIQDEILKARIAMLNEVIHQSRTNLKTSEAVAQWAEMRIATLSTKD